MKCPYFTEEESGVSPVIGVMLMLVVTIIIAAVVSGFAGGLTDSSTDVPVAAFEFKAYSAFMIASSHGGAGPYLEAIMKSGEAIDTGDLKIVSYYEDADRNIISHEFTQSPEFQGAHGSKTPSGVLTEGGPPTRSSADPAPTGTRAINSAEVSSMSLVTRTMK
ncbi:type IV pilin N-terminal domain-containing protein [Methanogenium cariaci]|uniref:type IV pilin N-terminal domain-containing protein n=1 Tax=Methanogenium cariaci TaxID=2197 RepID=UPI0007815D1F|nr:type IV pilin N-terminal domain-containing protein [Methanogenium cariaci]